MENLRELKDQLNNISSEYMNLCSDFLMLYSRFEYALKESGYLQGRGNAMASMKDFLTNIEDHFNPEVDNNLNHSVNYILNHPPRKQMKLDERLVWRDQEFNGSLIQELGEYVRRIRNSLMHGAKFHGQIREGGRNWRLLTSAMFIVEHWINLDDSVRDSFRIT